jgi:two-component system, NtrC family, sensor kinase
MVAITILVSFAPLFLISGIIGYRFQTSYRVKVTDHLRELVQKHQQNIDSFLHAKLSEIGVMAYQYSFEELANEQLLQERLANLRQVYGAVFVDLGVVDERGHQIAYAGPFQLRQADYADADWFKKAIVSQYFISDVFMGLRRQPHFIVAAKQESGGKEWILRATIDFEAFNTLVENLRIGTTGSAFILNRDGEFQTKPRTEPILGKDYFVQFLAGLNEPAAPPAGDQGPEPKTANVEARKVFSPRVSVIERIDRFGRGDIYVVSPLKGSDWILVFQQDAADAFSDLYQARGLAFLILILGGMAIVITAIVVSRSMVNRIKSGDLEREKMNEQVIEAGKLASVGELAAGIAHEINNPVAVMVEEAGWIEDLLTEPEFHTGENLDELKRALVQIKTQGARCREITHKLLSFARKTDPKEREIQINDVLEEIVSLLEQRAQNDNVRIMSQLAADLPTVYASPSEMQQVFLNLVNNAIDAIGANGGTIELTSRLEGKYVVVDVADTGEGIPKANLARIFDPFFTTKPVGKGTGLGLSICYGIVNKLGGEVSVNSAVGLGTTFHVRLLHTAKQSGTEASAPGGS